MQDRPHFLVLCKNVSIYYLVKMFLIEIIDPKIAGDRRVYSVGSRYIVIERDPDKYPMNDRRRSEVAQQSAVIARDPRLAPQSRVDGLSAVAENLHMPGNSTAPSTDHVGLADVANEFTDLARREPRPMCVDNRRVSNESGDVVLRTSPLVFGLSLDETLARLVCCRLVGLGSHHVCHGDMSEGWPQAPETGVSCGSAGSTPRT